MQNVVNENFKKCTQCQFWWMLAIVKSCIFGGAGTLLAALPMSHFFLNINIHENMLRFQNIKVNSCDRNAGRMLLMTLSVNSSIVFKTRAEFSIISIQYSLALPPWLFTFKSVNQLQASCIRYGQFLDRTCLFNSWASTHLYMRLRIIQHFSVQCRSSIFNVQKIWTLHSSFNISCVLHFLQISTLDKGSTSTVLQHTSIIPF